MYYIKDDGTHQELLVNSFAPDIEINFNLMPLSNGSFRSMSTRDKSDRYSTVLYLSSMDYTYLNTVVKDLEDLRVADKPMVIEDLQENIFGEHVLDTSFSAIVLEVSKITNTGLRTGGVEIRLLISDPAVSSDNPPLPLDMENLQSGYETHTEKKVDIVESYGSSTVADRTISRSYFTGEYYICNEDVAAMYNIWRATRGTPITVNEDEWGVDNMFGPTEVSDTHQAIIIGMEYQYTSPSFKLLKIQLVKVI